MLHALSIRIDDPDDASLMSDLDDLDKKLFQQRREIMFVVYRRSGPREATDIIICVLAKRLLPVFVTPVISLLLCSCAAPTR